MKVTVNGGFIGADLGSSSNDLSHNLKDRVVEKVSTSIVYRCGLAGPKYVSHTVNVVIYKHT